jgi:flagellar motor switch protein FliN/FliY
MQPAREEAPPTGRRRPGDFDRVLDIPVVLHVELGRKRMRIGELLDMGTGSILELDTPAGAALALYANETLIARGEAVVVGDRYGVRITDIPSPSERAERLGHGGVR